MQLKNLNTVIFSTKNCFLTRDTVVEILNKCYVSYAGHHTKYNKVNFVFYIIFWILMHGPIAGRDWKLAVQVHFSWQKLSLTTSICGWPGAAQNSCFSHSSLFCPVLKVELHIDLEGNCSFIKIHANNF